MNESTSVGVAEQLTITAAISNEPIDGQTEMHRFIVQTESKFSNVYVIAAPDAKTAVEWVLDSNAAPDFIQRHLGERAVHVERTEFTDPLQAKAKFPNYF